jgi:hypothetical protein
VYKRCHVFLYVLIISLEVLMIGSVCLAFQEPNILMKQDFQNMQLDAWNVQSGVIGVVSDPTDSSGQNLCVEFKMGHSWMENVKNWFVNLVNKTKGEEDLLWAMHDFADYSSGFLIAKYRIMVTQRDNTLPAGYLGLGSVGIDFGCNGRVVYFDGSMQDESRSYVANEWYQIQYIVDLDNQKYDFFIDGVEIEVNKGYRKAAESISSILFGIPKGYKGKVYFDDVEITHVPTSLDWTIVANTDMETHLYGAKQLQAYLCEIFGVGIPVKSHTSEVHGRLILIGGTDVNQRVKELILTQSLTEDLSEQEFVIKEKNGNLILAGGDTFDNPGPGTLYSIYTFLEDYLGVRWYYVDMTDQIIPSRRLSQLPEIILGIDDVRCPEILYRERTLLTGGDFYQTPRELDLLSWEIDWMAKNKMNVAMFEETKPHQYTFFADNLSYLADEIFPAIKRYGMKVGVGGHNWLRFVSTETPGYNKDTWGIVKNGVRLDVGPATQFCLTGKTSDEPGPAKIAFIQNVIQFVKTYDLDIIGPWPNDGGAWSEGSVDLERSKEYRYIELFNDLVEALNAEAEDVTSPLYGKKIPVLMMAYGNLKDPPPEGESNIQPHDDIILLFTPWGRDYKQPFYSSVFDGQLLKWKDYFEQSETGASLGLHTKYARHLLLGYHLLPLDIIPIDFLYFGNVGVEYIELHSGYEGWWTKGLTLFACAKAFWNTGLDLSRLVEDYFENYYGSAASIMKEYYYRSRDANRNVLTGQEYLRYGTENLGIWYFDAGSYGNFPGLTIHGGEDYVRFGVPEYFRNAVNVFADCIGYFDEARIIASEDPALLQRIIKAQRSMEYRYTQLQCFNHQLTALALMEDAHNNSKSSEEYISKLDKADMEFYMALKTNDERLTQAQQYRDQGVIWDYGIEWNGRLWKGTQGSNIGALRRLVQESRRFAMDRKWGAFTPIRGWNLMMPISVPEEYLRIR